MSTLMRILPRLALVLVATIFMASLAIAGALVALVYAAWSLLRGRKPQWPTIFMGPLRHMHRRSEPRWHARSGDAGVIEGQAREL